MPKRPKDPEAESESLSDSEEAEVQEEHYEYDDFVVPDDEVDEGLPPTHGDKSEKKKKSRKRISKRQRPDPEDLELAGATSTIRATNVDALEAQLFREPAPGNIERERSPPRPRDDDNDGSEKDGFIVDAEDTRPGQDFPMEKYTPKVPELSKAVFEPSDIKSRFGLPEDELIRIMDLPERMQRNLKCRLEPSEAELEQETDWLLRKVMANKAYFNLQEVKTKIRHFLQLYRVDKFETGFLQTYRIHLLSPELTEEDLWDMTRLDLEWGFVFEQKRRTRAILIEAAANSQVLEAAANSQVLEAGTQSEAGTQPGAGTQPEARTQLETGKKILLQGYSPLPKDVEELLDSTSDANCFFEVEDLSHYLETVLTTYEPSGSGGRLACNRVLISGRKLHMNELAAKSGLSPVQLADNIREMRRVHNIVKNSVKPQELAFDYLCDEFKDEAKVLLMLSNYMKKELIGQPALRSFTRAKYAYHVRVYTSPTEKGKEVLDVFHPCYRTKSLGRLHSSEGEVKEGKDVDSFGKGDLWLEVVKCEAEGLIDVSFVLPWTDWKDDKILMELKAFYLSGEGLDEVEADWNEFRTEILRSTLAELYESLQKEYRRYLTIRAEENVLRKCREEYQKMLMQPPYILRDEEWSSPRVFSLVSDPSSPKYGFVALVVLDTTGEVMDSVNFTALLKWEKEVLQPTEKERNSTDIKTFQRMLLTYRPDVLILGANSLQTVLLRRVIVTQCRLMTVEGFEKSLVEWNVDPSALLTKMPDVMMGSLEAPKLFGESHRGKRMLSDMTPLQRQAVSLGRYLQHPAAELLGLWIDPNENLTMRLKLHMLQKLLPEKQLLDSLEEAAIKVCSYLGADINYMLDHTHLRAPLSFIPGLGMIKAHSIFENLMRTGHLLVRHELLYKDFLKVRVYENCIGFIIIKAADKSDPLDRTRIHPEHYDIAKKIAASALDSVDEEDERNVERVMKNPERLDRGDLDLDDYAKYLEAKGRANMKSVILMVVKEMKQPFHVPWNACEDLPPLKVLYLTTGETEYTLRPGVIVNAMVTSVMTDKPPRCKLECGLDASAKGIGFDAKEGSSVRARVTKLIAESKSPESLFFQAQLSCIDTDLQSHEPFRSTILQLTELDPAFAEDPNDWKETVYMEEEMKNGQKYIPRVINHPKFRNVGLITALNELERKDIGECLFRPSSRGSDHVTCTFKFYDFVYSHLDIIEEGKPADNMLGSRFKIGEEVYESLQEIIERYVVPVATLTKDAIAHKKFIDLTNNGMENLEAILRSEKQSKPASIPYYFTIFPQYPQFFVLCYIPKERIHKEYIKVKPKGLFFHERLHPNINYLISWFKRHYSESAYQTLMTKSKPPIVVTANLFAVPSKKNDRPMTPHRDEDRRYESGGRNSPAYSGRADSERALRHTPRRDADPVEDQWSTPKNSSDPWANSWGTPRTPVEEEPPRSRPPQIEDQDEDRQRGNRGTRRSVRGGRGCYVCGEEGHISKNCPKSPHGPSGICYNCEKPGHLARDCPEEPRRQRTDRRPSKRDRDEPKDAGKPGDEDRTADAWGDSSWEAPPKPQGWGPTDKMHVDEDKWGCAVLANFPISKMTSVAMRLLRPLTHHVHSLAVFNKALPEFSDTSAQANNLVDEAFHSSLVEDNGDLKYWKSFRERVTGKTQNLTPRELARLKYALTHRGKEGVKYAKWGRVQLHSQLDAQCAAQVGHMNAHELLSSLYGFHATQHERIFLAAYQALLNEIKSVSDLDLLSVAPYIVSHSAIHTRYIDAPKTEKTRRNFELLKVIQDLCVSRITEMSDDQLATLCAGIGNSDVHPEKRIQLKDLMDGIESDILNRRLDRMSGSNLADVGVGFTKMNWGSEQLFTGLQEYAKKKLTTMESDEVADLAFGLASRDDLDKEFQGHLDAILLEKMVHVRPDFVNRLALYLFLTQSQNEKLIQAFITHVEQGPSIPLSKHYAFRQLRTFLETKHSGLISEELRRKIDENSISFIANSMIKQNPRHATATYQTMSSLFGQLGFRMATPYVYENLGFVDFARMPERVAINIALPCYDLIGKYEPDERLVKDPIRVFKTSKMFRMRGELFRMKGFKVLDWNMHHMADNLESSKQRNDFIIQSLAAVGIQPEPQKPKA